MTTVLVVLLLAFLVAAIRVDYLRWRRQTDYSPAIANIRPEDDDAPLDITVGRVVRHNVRRLDGGS